MSLRTIFQGFVERNIMAPDPYDDEAQFGPIVNSIARRTSWHPAWIAEKLDSWSQREDLFKAEPADVMAYLKSFIPAEASCAP